MDRALDQSIRARAGGLCEYCFVPQSVSKLTFPIDHVIARQHGGPTTLENLALCCGRCNQAKGPNIASVDPLTGEIVRLFHPRRDAWAEHFRYDGSILVGLTPVGRATVNVLAINQPQRAALRQSLIDLGLFRP